MTVSLDTLTPENGFPTDLTYGDKICLVGQGFGFPDMPDDDKIFLLQEACKWEKERKGLMHINPYLDPDQVLDLLGR